MTSSFFTAEIASQRNAQLIAEAKEYRLAKAFRRSSRGGAGAKTHSGDRVPDRAGKAAMA